MGTSAAMEHECVVIGEQEDSGLFGNETYCSACRRMFRGGTAHCPICGRKDLVFAALANFERCGVCRIYPVTDVGTGACVSCHHILDALTDRIDCYRSPEAFEI